MIATVSGKLIHKGADHVIVEAAGVGYRLSVSGFTFDALPPVGSSALVHTELVVREDSMQLYGFAEPAERELFVLLTSVSGVGPKVALAVLSGMSVPDIETALATGNAVRFQAVPGIGKRTAERLVVELKDKIIPSGAPTVLRGVTIDDPTQLARDGLLGLGYTLGEVESMIAAASGETPAELIASALRGSAA